MTIQADPATMHLNLAEPDHPNVPKEGPVPLLVRVARPGEDEPNAWLVRENGRVAATLALAEAEQASARRYAFGQTQEGRDLAHRLYRARSLAQGTAVPAAEWQSWVSHPDLDEERGFKASVAELIEDHDDRSHPEVVPPPAWVFGTHEAGFDFDLADAIESYCGDNHHEDAFDQLDMKPLLEFFSEWQKKQNLVSYQEARKTIVVIDQARYEAELVEARALLETDRGRV